jgi:hypothetical protein
MIHNILVRVIFEKSSPETCFSRKKNISLHYLINSTLSITWEGAGLSSPSLYYLDLI